MGWNIPRSLTQSIYDLLDHSLDSVAVFHNSAVIEMSANHYNLCLDWRKGIGLPKMILPFLACLIDCAHLRIS